MEACRPIWVVPQSDLHRDTKNRPPPLIWLFVSVSIEFRFAPPKSSTSFLFINRKTKCRIWATKKICPSTERTICQLKRKIFTSFLCLPPYLYPFSILYSNKNILKFKINIYIINVKLYCQTTPCSTQSRKSSPSATPSASTPINTLPKNTAIPSVSPWSPKHKWCWTARKTKWN